MGFLTEMNAHVRRSLSDRPLDVDRLRDEVDAMPPPRGFSEALADDGPSLIAEVKRSSPSVGHIADTDPADRARSYADGGAAAVSVLTEGRHFGGSLEDLRAVHLATTVPVLRKDFLVEPSQLLEARACGADAVLLIAASLSRDALGEMLATADDLRLGVLLETHSVADLEKALETDSRVVGVNARDLETLEVDVERALGMLSEVPADRIAVLESGVSQRQDVVRARASGARAVLVGEALMRAADPAAKIRELLEGES